MDYGVPCRKPEDTADLFYYHNSFKKPHLIAKQIQLLNLLPFLHPAYSRPHRRAGCREKFPPAQFHFMKRGLFDEIGHRASSAQG
jgi:hypothetical protein